MAKINKLPPAFPHRLKPDGTYASVCIKCFRTVVPSLDETELFIAEQTHVCAAFSLENIFHPEF
jgi:hypothetical protein